MEVRGIAVKDELVKSDSSVTQAKEEKKVVAFSADQNEISKAKSTSNGPFIQINPKASFKDITFVANRRGVNVPEPTNENEENLSTFQRWKSLFKSLPVTDRGLDDESDQYAFAPFPKSDKKYQLGDVKGKLESFSDITGVERGTFRILYGNTTGDKKFNFDGAAIGLELEARQNAYSVNQYPDILLPVDNNSNYFFEQRNLTLAGNTGSVTGVFSLEGVKVDVKYEKDRGIGISNVEFHEGALTTNLVDFSKKYPYYAIPIALAVAGGAVAGGYFISKKTGPINLDLANITVYRLDSEKNDLRLGISPSFSITGADKFFDNFKVPGGAASILYKYDDNLTLSLNGGYNPIDGPHVFSSASMKF